MIARAPTASRPAATTTPAAAAAFVAATGHFARGDEAREPDAGEHAERGVEGSQVAVVVAHLVLGQARRTP